jgi:hypothetical protein
MERRSKLVALWALMGLLVALIVGAMARPMMTGWRCYRMHASGEHASAQLVEKLGNARLLLQIESGSQAGSACTASTSARHYRALRLGELLAVVYRTERPGECVLAATLENSAALLWSLTGAIAVIVLLIVWAGISAQRSFFAPAFLTSYLDVDGKDMKCPQCGGEMAEGYLALLAGLHWREIGEPIGLPHALGGLPGTVGWRTRPRLHAFRCKKCSVVTFKYADRPRGGPQPSPKERWDHCKREW